MIRQEVASCGSVQTDERRILKVRTDRFDAPHFGDYNPAIMCTASTHRFFLIRGAVVLADDFPDSPAAS
jgi:hypothetical protein